MNYRLALDIGADVCVWIFCILGSLLILWILNNKDVFIEGLLALIRISKEEKK